MGHQDVLAVGPLVLHPPDVGMDRGQLRRDVGVWTSEPLERLLSPELLVGVPQVTWRLWDLLKIYIVQIKRLSSKP